ncbi:hypothetical protein SNE40_000325 [Patella caerulea]|uniref:Uncharacterized protein n=1 Tax=Patella caerulea TaxID=87958 RepID=A0AAN8QGU3_PATCE
MNGTPYTPRSKPHPRIKPEAQENAMKNRGGMEKWFDYDQNINDYNSPRPGDRLRTDEAKKIADVNKGCMNEFMEGYPDRPVERELHPRGVTGAGAEIADMNKGKGMKNLIDNYGNLGISDRPNPKVKGQDASENAERNHGQVNDVLNNYGNHPLSPPPNQKVSYGGEEVANKHKGKDMGPIIKMEGGKRSPREGKQRTLHQESDGMGWDELPPHQRIRPEAEQIISKYSKSDMTDIMKGAKSPNHLSPKTKILKHMTESEVPRPRTSPARTRPEAMQYYQRNNDSEMAAIMGGGTPITNGVHNNRNHSRMLNKSEDW